MAAIDLLLRVGTATGTSRYTSLADRILRYVGGGVRDHPDMWGTLVAAVNHHQVVVASLAGPSAPTLGMPGTADRVRVTATTLATGDHDEIVTTLTIDPGWHVNANPASFDYLIPTSVSFEGLSATRVVYPTAARIKPRFAPDGLDVYESETKLVAVFPKGALTGVDKIDGTLTVQACSDEVCLPPAQIPITVER